MDTIKNVIPLNWGLIANPFNWVVIVLMMTLGGLALALLFHPADDYVIDDGT